MQAPPRIVNTRATTKSSSSTAYATTRTGRRKNMEGSDSSRARNKDVDSNDDWATVGRPNPGTMRMSSVSSFNLEPDDMQHDDGDYDEGKTSFTIGVAGATSTGKPSTSSSSVSSKKSGSSCYRSSPVVVSPEPSSMIPSPECTDEMAEALEEEVFWSYVGGDKSLAGSIVSKATTVYPKTKRSKKKKKKKKDGHRSSRSKSRSKSRGRGGGLDRRDSEGSVHSIDLDSDSVFSRFIANGGTLKNTTSGSSCPTTTTTATTTTTSMSTASGAEEDGALAVPPHPREMGKVQRATSDSRVTQSSRPNVIPSRGGLARHFSDRFLKFTTGGAHQEQQEQGQGQEQELTPMTTTSCATGALSNDKGYRGSSFSFVDANPPSQLELEGGNDEEGGEEAMDTMPKGRTHRMISPRNLVREMSLRGRFEKSDSDKFLDGFLTGIWPGSSGGATRSTSHGSSSTSNSSSETSTSSTKATTSPDETSSGGGGKRNHRSSLPPSSSSSSPIAMEEARLNTTDPDERWRGIVRSSYDRAMSSSSNQSDGDDNDNKDNNNDSNNQDNHDDDGWRLLEEAKKHHHHRSNDHRSKRRHIDEDTFFSLIDPTKKRRQNNVDNGSMRCSVVSAFVLAFFAFLFGAISVKLLVDSPLTRDGGDAPTTITSRDEDASSSSIPDENGREKPPFLPSASPLDPSPALLDLLYSNFNQNVLQDITSPSYMALDWLINVDPLYLANTYVHAATSGHDESSREVLAPRVVQRFALASIYFSVGQWALESKDAEEGGGGNQVDKKDGLHHQQNPADDSNNNGNSLWLSSYEECWWDGVWCDTIPFQSVEGVYEELHVVTNLDLTGMGLTGPIPDDMAALMDLRHLRLGGNELSGFIPTWFKKLEALENLDLSHNHLVGPIPVELGSLNHLEELRLEGNSLTGQVPTKLCQESRPPPLELTSDCGVDAADADAVASSPEGGQEQPPLVECSCCSKCYHR